MRILDGEELTECLTLVYLGSPQCSFRAHWFGASLELAYFSTILMFESLIAQGSRRAACFSSSMIKLGVARLSVFSKRDSLEEPVVDYADERLFHAMSFLCTCMLYAQKMKLIKTRKLSRV